MAALNDMLSAVNQIAAERAIDKDEVMKAIKDSIKENFVGYEDVADSLEVEFEENGRIGVYVLKKIVIRVKDARIEIDLKEAKKLDKTLKKGELLKMDITPSGDFGRVAAQTARQNIMRKIRESERDTQLEEFKKKLGEIESGVVQRMDDDVVIVELRRLSALMLPEDRVPGEQYRSGNRIKVLVKEIMDMPKGKALRVSRSDPDFLKALFTLEIPEVDSGSVEIKAIAREAGARSKVAVYSNTEGVDPIGSCVGQKGIRINTIMNELKFGRYEEKVDIILWDRDIETFISNALSPAQTISVQYNTKENSAVVTVPNAQLSLAIGKEGQNARLAAKLTGIKIDIKPETIEVPEEKNLVAIEGKGIPTELEVKEKETVKQKVKKVRAKKMKVEKEKEKKDEE